MVYCLFLLKNWEHMPAKLKLLLLLTADVTIIICSQLLTLFVLNAEYVSLFSPMGSASALLISAWLVKLYRTSLSHFGIAAVWQAFVAILTSSIMMILFGESFDLVLFSSLLSFIGIVSYRVIAREILFQKRSSNAAGILVYGAGSAGIQFVTASMQGDTHNVIGYVDDDKKLCGTSIHGRYVFPSKSIKKLVKKHNIQMIVLALPSIDSIKRKEIIELLIPLPARVVTVPTYEDLIEGKQITQTEDISLEDLLGRDTVPPIDKHMKAQTQGKVCLVTGAGGSIGSELSRQIAKCQPKHIILLDISEPALFNIEQDLLQTQFINISCYLGSVTDNDLLSRVFSENKIDTVFHAAAYKHVPMVEANPIAGLINNVEGTKKLLNATINANCNSFTLISTDKAVRPTSVMGATKRLAEMTCQLAAESNASSTSISIVRFGNVLGSSGSVIPTFVEQIKKGGPVTLTHPDMTRYFMTIPEAAQLVIQSSGMAKSGDLFLLDMGTPVKIYDLAIRLIRLSGKSVQQNGNNKKPGAIEIKITGLRPGEKLYEELLVDSNSQETEHTKIMRAREKYISKEAIESGMKDLFEALNRNDQRRFRTILTKTVEGYKIPKSSEYV
jgi:FlaA1/EpsC-like NDP-sugar epimerase